MVVASVFQNKFQRTCKVPIPIEEAKLRALTPTWLQDPFASTADLFPSGRETRAQAHSKSGPATARALQQVLTGGDGFTGLRSPRLSGRNTLSTLLETHQKGLAKMKWSMRCGHFRHLSQSLDDFSQGLLCERRTNISNRWVTLLRGLYRWLD